jgi:hypothetical protein
MAQLTQHEKSDLQVGQSSRDGDLDARLVKVYVATANQDTVVPHGLGRIPRHIELTWKDGFLDYKVSKDSKGRPMVDKEKIVIQFSAASITAVIRFA